jgi:hypothetical protein
MGAPILKSDSRTFEEKIMETGILIVSIGLLVGCSRDTGSSVPTQRPQVGGVISSEQAIAIASGTNTMEYYRDGRIEVELTNGQYIVTFPIDKRAKPGTRYRGPDYAAKFWIDSKTGKVLKGQLGG